VAEQVGPPRRSRRAADEERARRAAEALAQARADSLARGNHPVQPGGPARGPQRQPGDTPGDAPGGGAVPGSAADPERGADRPEQAGGAAVPATAAADDGPGPTAQARSPAVAGGAGDAGRVAQDSSPAAPARYRRRARRDDPQPLNSAIEGLIDENGWRLAAATGSVFGRWAQIVGPELAAHTRPEGLAAGELTVTADSTAWATQVRLLAGQLVRRLNTELGDGAVKRVKVRGPTAPRQPGQWRVKGGRGPRDTYG
jgi:predicted nucleic acid-binding Zn ribbon protein